MKLRDALSLDLNDAMKLSEKELKEAITTIRKTARRELTALEQSEWGQYSPVVRKGIFKRYDMTVAGKNLPQLRSTLERAQQYMRTESHNITGTKAYVSRISALLGNGADISAVLHDGDFWAWVDETGLRDELTANSDIYRKAGELYADYVIKPGHKSERYLEWDRAYAEDDLKRYIADRGSSISKDILTTEADAFAEAIEARDRINEDDL